ncbi:hypothetical protein AB1Y20_021218 [Prymnesium parvum]|uniref:Phytanoyl-CoA dioxygenase family protein n=1 Tax=Prymnesium parvum TaxID=97485 RepID=A0AB34JLN4_PRYPA
MAEGEAAARLRSSEHERVRSELETRGFAVCRSMLPLSSIARARQHLEKAVDRHLQRAAARGDVPHSFAGLSLEERIAAAYRTSPEQAPTSWVAETRTSLAFQGMLFRDAQLCALVETLTSRPPVVASRYNVRSKLPGSTNANFPWHQDHAFFRMQYLLKKQAAKRLLAAWAPLVAVSEANGAVELAAGSHTRGFAKHTRSGAFMAAEEPPSSALERVVPSLNPGDVLLFTDLTLHRSGPNLLPTVRWSADWAYELDPSDSICPPLAVHLLRNEQATEEQAPLQLRNTRSRLLLAACAALVTTSVAMLLQKRIRR